MSDILLMLLIIIILCVESDKIPLLQKLKKCLPVGFLIDTAYTANNILYKSYTKMAVYF